MTFASAVRDALSHYGSFRGRSRRAEFWWFALFCGLVRLVALVADKATGSVVLDIAVSLALLLPTLAVTVRRLHDTDHSGWWWLIALVPAIGWIVLLVLQCLDSQPGTNRFGDSPKNTAMATR
jgi:uncharacterized membrane protein YhaH (DUF805 family)